METNKNSKAVLYCSLWPDEGASISLEDQSVELQTYCLINNLEVVDILFDLGPRSKDKHRLGMERLHSLVRQEGIAHVVVYDVGRVGRNRREIMAFLKNTFDIHQTEVHIVKWNLSTGSQAGAKMLSMAEEINDFDFVEKSIAPVLSSEKYRLKPLWSRLFSMLQDERFAEVLIKGLFTVKDSVQLSEKESLAVHGGYDHLNMFRALGFRIKGEKTDNTKLVADVLVRYWDKLKPQLGADIQKIIEGSETGALPGF